MKYGSISSNTGSMFRNPSELGVAAAELIEKAELKGFRGGAMISNIHANFFINAGGDGRSNLELNLLMK